MTTDMNDPVCEQLSAWMDGELSPEEAKFLERRLQHDETLQALYARMQVMSACMKGQQVRPMPRSLCENIKAQLASEPSPLSENTAIVVKKRSPIFAWAAAASIAALAVVFAPRLWQESAQPISAPDLVATQKNDTYAAPTFASADMVAQEARPEVASFNLPKVKGDVLENPTASRGEQSPMPLANVESPENFPLNASTQKKTWPHSSLASDNDPALEAYLVRHNQMMTDGGLGGFVPYVDVMSEGQEKTPANESTEVSDQ
jgi:negative regulator of sigma E activity